MRERLDRYFLRGCFADTDVEANPGSGGAKFAVDNDGTDNWPYCKLAWGASGTQTHVAAGAGSIPIQDGGNSITVDGTVAVSNITACNTGAVVLSSGTVTTVSTVTSLSQFAGAAINLGSGTIGTGTLRVVLATDQPQLTNKLLVTPDLPSGASTAAKQPALGTAGTASTDVITIQGIASMTKLLVTPDANSAVNVSQINGVTPLMGAGNTGTGSHRVTIASDQVAVAVKTGTRSYKTASGTLTADTDVVAAVSSKRIKVYAFSVTTVGTNANAAIWKSNGTSGTELWRTLLQGASGSPMGERLAVAPGVDGAFLFATVAGEKLTLDVGNGDTLHYSLAYWDDDAT